MKKAFGVFRCRRRLRNKTSLCSYAFYYHSVRALFKNASWTNKNFCGHVKSQCCCWLSKYCAFFTRCIPVTLLLRVAIVFRTYCRWTTSISLTFLLCYVVWSCYLLRFNCQFFLFLHSSTFLLQLAITCVDRSMRICYHWIRLAFHYLHFYVL